MDPEAKSRALARHYLDVENPRRALEVLAQATGDDLESSEFWELRAEALFELERYADGAQAAREGLARDPDEIVLLDLLFLCELNLDNTKAAEDAITAALELAPWHPHLVAHRALLLARTRRFREAEEAIEEAMAIDPEDAMVLRVRAQVASLAGDRKRAERYSHELLALEPEDRIAHVLHGNVAVQNAQFGRALRHFEEALRLDPKDSDLVEVVRENRVAAHPIFVPLRPIFRFGRYRSWALYLVVYWTLRASGQTSLALAIGGVWLVLVAISWLAPPILRRYYGRNRFGL